MRRPPSRRRGLAIVSRIAAAAGAGYGLSAMSAAWLALALPLTRVEATVTGTLLAFVVYVCAVMWAFAAPTARAAWIGLLAPMAVLGALTLIATGTA